METTTALLATLVAIWFMTSVALFVHANTQDKVHASESAHTVREAQALATSTVELLEVFYTVQAERDALRTELALWATRTHEYITNEYIADNGTPATFAELEVALLERHALINLVTALLGRDEYRDASELQADLVEAIGEGWSIAGYAEAFTNGEGVCVPYIMR